MLFFRILEESTRLSLSSFQQDKRSRPLESVSECPELTERLRKISESPEVSEPEKETETPFRAAAEYSPGLTSETLDTTPVNLPNPSLGYVSVSSDLRAKGTTMMESKPRTQYGMDVVSPSLTETIATSSAMRQPTVRVAEISKNAPSIKEEPSIFQSASIPQTQLKEPRREIEATTKATISTPLTPAVGQTTTTSVQSQSAEIEPESTKNSISIDCGSIIPRNSSVTFPPVVTDGAHMYDKDRTNKSITDPCSRFDIVQKA